MSKINGTLYAVNSGSEKLLYATSSTMNVNVDLPDVTNKDSNGWAEHLNGLRDWSIDFDALYDEDGTGLVLKEIVSAIINRTADTVITFAPTTGATMTLTGNGTFGSISLSADSEQPISGSGTITGNGPLVLS